LQVSANLETLAFNVKMPDRGTTIDSLMMGQADSGYVFEIRLEAALLPRLKVQVLIVDAKCVGDQLVAGVVVPLHRQLRRHVAGRTNLHPGGCTLEPSRWAVIEFDGGSPNSVDLPDVSLNGGKFCEFAGRLEFRLAWAGRYPAE